MNERPGLRLRPVRLEDEAEFRAAHASLLQSDDFAFGLFFEEAPSWSWFVASIHDIARGQNLVGDRVPDTQLVAVVDGMIVGRVSIRHELNDFLAREGGHIGYAVLAEHRRRGYATEILRQAVIIAASLGVRDAVLFCDDDNVRSATVIERCGGVLVERSLDSAGTPQRRYVIAL